MSRPVALLVLAFSAAAQPQSTPTPKFDVVSVKPCGSATPTGAAGGPKGGASGGPGNQSPGHLYIGCVPVRVLLILVMGALRHGEFPDDWNFGNQPLELSGGPDWIGTDQFLVEAKTDSGVSRDMMSGPMLKAILEERFHLKAHRETREVPTYELTVAKGGLKLSKPGDTSCTEPSAARPIVPINCSKLQRRQEGNCTPRDRMSTPPAPGSKPACDTSRATIGDKRSILDILDAPMSHIASLLRAGRPVIDRTGVAGKFDVHLEYVPDGKDVSDDPDGVPTIFTVVARLGLKLEPAKGPRDFLVIDHLERPTEN